MAVLVNKDTKIGEGMIEFANSPSGMIMGPIAPSLGVVADFLLLGAEIVFDALVEARGQRNAEQWPESFKNPQVSFVDQWTEQVSKVYDKVPVSPKEPCFGIVLQVEENAKPTPGSPAYVFRKELAGQQPSCLKVWVHTPFDRDLLLPQNFLTPSPVDMELIMLHPSYEVTMDVGTPGITTPTPGDIVKVRHPWAWGFTNKFGELLTGHVARLGAFWTSEAADQAFLNQLKKKCGTKKDVPRGSPHEGQIPA